jgi:flagellar biosynthetic protein FliR
MIGIGSDTVLAVFVIFCRIGGCLMLMAGVSSPRVPMQIRLFLAVAITLAVAPLMVDSVKASIPNDEPLTLVQVIGTETLIGVMIGFLGRIFFLALQTLAHAMATTVGYSMPGMPIEDQEGVPSMTTLVMMTATLLFFMTDQHLMVLRATMNSYSALPINGGFNPQAGLIQITDTLGTAFMLALRLASPFIMYGLIVNFALGLLNKMTPTIPVYFVSMPFVLMGGLLLFYFTAGEFQQLFVMGFADWLANE